MRHIHCFLWTLCLQAIALVNGLELKEARADCVIFLDDTTSWPLNPPIITDALDYPVLPQGRYDLDDRNIVVPEGDILKLACSESAFSEFPGTVAYLEARCIGGSQFSVTPPNGAPGSYGFDQLGCTLQPDSHTEEITLCGPNNEGLEIDIAFSTSDGFESILTVCFDPAQSRSIYAVHTLYQEIVARDTGNDRPFFDPDIYYPFDVNNYYTQVEQDATIQRLTGIDYVDPSTDYYLARGHLSPNSDFIYYSWQDATFYFMNVAPQWQVFNGQNWFYLEDGTRDFVEGKGNLDVVIYTGTSGVLELLDTNQNKVEIWLYSENSNDLRLPVPKYYWKVLVDTANSLGVAFVGVNNPYLPAEDLEVAKICPPLDNHPIMENIFYPDDISRGVLFACLVSDAAAVIPEIPELGDLGLLS